MKPRLIVLSDLWGFEKSTWIKDYVEILETKFDVQLYDCGDLGQIEPSKQEETYIHHQFITGGIDLAVNRLLELEHKPIDVLAFSIGGTIAWKAQLRGLKINNLYALSSTRLRYETVKPTCRVNLYFGENDSNKPTSEWFDKLELSPKTFENKGHDLYTDIDCINEVCKEITSSLH